MIDPGPDRYIAWPRSLDRSSWPAGSVPMVKVLAASLTAKVPGTTALAEATWFSWPPSRNISSGSAAIGLAPTNRALKAASPPIIELNSVVQPLETQTEPLLVQLVTGTEPSNQTTSPG